MSTAPTEVVRKLQGASSQSRDDRTPPNRRSKATGALKYRTSCDACQTAKVKCGREPSCCHRCSVQGIECVYSISRRIGRPRKPMNAAAANPTRTADINPEIRASTMLQHAETVVRHDKSLQQNDDEDAEDSFIDVATTMEGTSCTPSRYGEEDLQIEQQAVSQPCPDEELRGSPAPCSDLTRVLDDFDFSVPHYPQRQPFDFTTSDMFDLSAYNEDLQAVSAGFSAEPQPFSGQFSMQSGGLHSPEKMGQHQHTSSMELNNTNDLISSLHLRSPGDVDKRGSMDDHIGLESSLSSSEGLPGTRLSQDTADTLQHSLNQQLALSVSSAGIAQRYFSESESNPTKRSSTATESCDCYSVIFQSISSSKSQQLEVVSMSVDMVLQIEAETQLMLARLRECRSCARDRTALLLSFISANRTLHLLENTARVELKPLRRLKKSLIRGTSTRNTFRDAASAPLQSKKCILQVGTFEVSEEDRTRFLRKILQSRIENLSAVLRCLHVTPGTLPDSTSKAATLMASDIIQGLQTVAGSMQLWD